MPKLVIVSNRLPVTVKADKAQLDFRESAGGPATELSSFYQERNAVWMGWPGNVPPRRQAEVRVRLRGDYAAEPVFIPEATVERFYEGYSNRTLWPLFHSFPTYTRYTAPDWDAYRQVNAQFARAVVDTYEPGDQVWVHDYQLLLLPGLLRAELPDVCIGFFLHIPFPPYDILRLLPQRREILEHLLGADLIGFHTYDYMDAFLSAADVALILPLRDGMNLVVKEYIAAQRCGVGMLVLSDTAGAAKELRQAIIVNPNSREEVAEAIHRALTMPEEKRLANCAAMSEWLASHDVRWWAGRFLARLTEAAEAARGLRQQDLEDGVRDELFAAYRAASRRLLLLDYDGTLAPFAERPEDARPSRALLEMLRRLAADPANEVVIVSGRDRESLGGWLGKLPLRLVAEHGAWARGRAAGDDWQQLGPSRTRWKKQVRPILERYVERIPGSFVEEKSFSLAWQYRAADIATASAAARELIDGLTNLTANTDIGVLQGHRVVEVKNERITKGGYYRGHLAEGGWDFELALGDDLTDETLFQVLPNEAWSVKVGFGHSAARFRLSRPADAIALLDQLARSRLLASIS